MRDLNNENLIIKNENMKNNEINDNPALSKMAVSGSDFTPYWVICVNSYEYDDTYIPKGRMQKHYSERPIQNKDWRRATQDEIDTKDWFKGNFFNLKNV